MAVTYCTVCLCCSVNNGKCCGSCEVDGHRDVTECSTCAGSGVVTKQRFDGPDWIAEEETCRNCGGTGDLNRREGPPWRPRTTERTF